MVILQVSVSTVQEAFWNDKIVCVEKQNSPEPQAEIRKLIKKKTVVAVVVA